MTSKRRHAGKVRAGVTRLALAWVVVGGLVTAGLVVNFVHNRPPSIRAITNRHAGRPLRIMLVGDSTMGTLGVGLAKQAPAANVDLINRAVGGCSLGIALVKGWLPSQPPNRWPPPAPCNTPGLLQKQWADDLTKFLPDVVVYTSFLDVANMYPSATAPDPVFIGQPAYDAQLTTSLENAVNLLSSTGAKVVLDSSPPTLFAQRGDVDDDPARWAAYNAILRSVAEQSDGKATVFDITTFFGGTGPVPKMQLYSPTGVQWRCGDGIHFDTAGGEFLAPSLFDAAWKLAAPRLAVTQHETPLPPKDVNQVWPAYITDAAKMSCPN